jgi:hypothetical protein
MDSATGEGAVQKEEDMASHPQQVHCSELKSRKVYLLNIFQHYMLFILVSCYLIKMSRNVPTTTSFTLDLVPSFLTLFLSKKTFTFRSLT